VIEAVPAAGRDAAPPDADAMKSAPAKQKLPPRRLACARCGAAFDCGCGGIDSGCWCMDEGFRLPMPSAAGADCLCPACLRAAASPSVGPSA